MGNLSQNARQKQQLKDEALLHIGDRRQYVHSSQFTKLPYNCIGLIRLRMVESPDRGSYATGCLISENIVLTSAHSFMHIDVRQKTLMTFEPYQFLIDLHLKEKCIKREVISWQYAKEYKKIQEKRILLKPHQKKEDGELYLLGIECDYAMIKLGQPVRRQTFPKLVPNYRTKGKRVSVCGFSQVNEEQFKQMVHTNILQYWKYGGAYRIDTEKGQSGSPVFFMSIPKGHGSESKSQACLVGVHKGSDLNQNRNICTLISTKVVKDLDGWSRKYNITFSVDGKIDYEQKREVYHESFGIKVKKFLQSQMIINFQANMIGRWNLLTERIKYLYKQFKKQLIQKFQFKKQEMPKPKIHNIIQHKQDNISKLNPQKSSVNSGPNYLEIFCLTITMFLLGFIWILTLLPPSYTLNRYFYFQKDNSIEKIAIAPDQSVMMLYDALQLTSKAYDPYSWEQIHDNKYKLEPHIFLNFYNSDKEFGIIYITTDNKILIRIFNETTHQQQVLFRGQDWNCLVYKLVVSADGKMWASGCKGQSKVIIGSIKKPRFTTIKKEILGNTHLVDLVWKPKTDLLTVALKNNQTGQSYLGTINSSNSQINWLNVSQGTIISLLYFPDQTLNFLERTNTSTVLGSYNFQTKKVKKDNLHQNFTRISLFGSFICLQTNNATFLYKPYTDEYKQNNYFFKVKNVIEYMGQVPGATFFFSKAYNQSRLELYKMHQYIRNYEYFYQDGSHTMQQCAFQCRSCLFSSYSCVSCQYGHYITPQRRCLSCSSAIKNCVTCSNSSVCLSCSDKYTIVRNKCVSCSDIIPNCIRCQGDQKCTQCFEGFYFSNGKCRSCGVAIEGCESCSLSGDNCKKCLDGWLAVDGKCVKCSQLMEGCLSCNSKISCQRCQEGQYKMVNSTCLPSHQTIKGDNRTQND